ncbi:hypothetical protein GDO86_013958 [Hymenochirus boettgeri]|uniref:Leucine-rich repeat-containing protein 59 n=1 Tax=Hymenochirus boettgeri TaxID=247094 RepID=A0A8T2JV16_9PIPI|nr:hypothetical protein GDO86_013958 [Hymenochirus boettgeri]
MSRTPGKHGNLREKLDGNELDLSLSDISEVPVRELAALPKATILDLSCNKLTIIPEEFCSLIHIVRLDLSKNQLVQLPSEFGRLINLQHLDLLQNRLAVLPITFSQLKNLKWLDLKDNPLNPTLSKAAGDCLDEKQCKECAQRVLQHMQSLQLEHDKEMQHKLLLDQERKQKQEAEQRMKEEKERALRKRKKQQQKERRRRDYNALQAAQKESKKKTEQQHTDNHKAAPNPKQKRQYNVVLAEDNCLHHSFSFHEPLCAVAVCHLTELKNHTVCTRVNTVYKEH